MLPIIRILLQQGLEAGIVAEGGCRINIPRPPSGLPGSASTSRARPPLVGLGRLLPSLVEANKRQHGAPGSVVIRAEGRHQGAVSSKELLFRVLELVHISQTHAKADLSLSYLPIGFPE